MDLCLWNNQCEKSTFQIKWYVNINWNVAVVVVCWIFEWKLNGKWTNFNLPYVLIWYTISIVENSKHFSISKLVSLFVNKFNIMVYVLFTFLTHSGQTRRQCHRELVDCINHKWMVSVHLVNVKMFNMKWNSYATMK